MRLVIIGYGYSAKAIHAALSPQLERLTVTTRSEAKAEALRAPDRNAVVFDGAKPSPELSAALADATHLLVSAAPDEHGDPFLRHHDLTEAPTLQAVAYLSTVGVYGNHDGAWVDEATLPQPVSKRSIWRLAAEEAWRARCIDSDKKITLGIFRLSGIYGPGRNPMARIQSGTSRRIIKKDQVFNRIHVTDIGRVASAALAAGYDGTLNVTDDEPAPPQDVIEHSAGLLGVDPPPALDFETADLSPMARSFYGENKRVSNSLSKHLFGPYIYPDYRRGLAALRAEFA